MPPSCALLGGFAICARVALLWQHYAGNTWQSPAVIRQAHRTPHACRTRTLHMPAKTPLAGDKIDAPAACTVPFRPYCGGVVTRKRNVSEYMLVLTLCLVTARAMLALRALYSLRQFRPSVCPSVRLSVRPSVTRRYCVKTTARSTVQFAPLDSKMCLVL